MPKKWADRRKIDRLGPGDYGMSFLIPVARYAFGRGPFPAAQRSCSALTGDGACGGKSIQGRAACEEDGSAHTLSGHAARARPI